MCSSDLALPFARLLATAIRSVVAMMSTLVHNACAACCHHPWTSDASRQDFMSGKRDRSLSKAVPTRRPYVVSRAVRSSLEAATDSRGSHSHQWFDLPYALSCPVDRDINVERWVEDSVDEIVKNIQEAPFLQYVYNSKGRFGRSQRQKVSQDLLQNPNHWQSVRKSLSTHNPDGVILVQKLDSGLSAPYCLARVFNEETACPLLADGAETIVWGVLVQARGARENACYLLKTTSVPSSAGICTRYCLTKAKCFGPSLIEQLENAWLL